MKEPTNIQRFVQIFKDYTKSSEWSGGWFIEVVWKMEWCRRRRCGPAGVEWCEKMVWSGYGSGVESANCSQWSDRGF